MGVTVSTDPPEIVYDLSDLATSLSFVYQYRGVFSPAHEAFFQHYSAVSIYIECFINNGSPFNLYTGSRSYVDVDLSGGFTNPGWVDGATQVNTENGITQPEASNILEPLTFSYMPLVTHSLTLSGIDHAFLPSHSYSFSQRRTAEIRGLIRTARLEEILALYPNATITFQVCSVIDRTIGWDVHPVAQSIEQITSTQTTTLPETTFNLSDFLPPDPDPEPAENCVYAEDPATECAHAEDSQATGTLAEDPATSCTHAEDAAAGGTLAEDASTTCTYTED